jgi:hypothetical protein
MPFSPSQFTIVNHRDPAAFAANANTTATDVRDFIDTIGVVFQVGANTAGSSPTYDAYIQTGPHSNGANAVNVTLANGANAAIVQATGASLQTLNIEKAKCDRYLKVVQAIGGTSSPSFPVTILIVGKKQVET